MFRPEIMVVVMMLRKEMEVVIRMVLVLISRCYGQGVRSGGEDGRRWSIRKQQMSA